MEKILEQVTDFADAAHGTQMRKYTPERYIVHPIRVMETCRLYDARLPILAAALLHDVLEDTDTTEQEMLHFLETVMDKQDALKTLQLVIEMTDVYVKTAYPQWNRRKRKQQELLRIEQTSPDAQTIKYADIIDNSMEIVAHDPQFGPKYLYEVRAVLKLANKGNQELYKLALNTVNKNLEKVRKN